MRKLSKRLREHLPAVKLYFDDLQRLEEALREAGEAVTIKSSGYELDTLDELKGLGETIRELELITSDSRVSVWISSYGVNLHAPEDDVTSRGLLAEVRTYLLTRRRWGSRWFRSPYSAGLGGLLLASSANIIVSLDSPDGALLPILVGGALFGGFLVFVSLGDRPKSVIFTSRRLESPTLWQRNKDQLFVNAVSLLVGGVVGFLFGRLS